MRFLILGPLEVRDEQGAVALNGTKLRGLLAMLLLHANEPMNAERLALALWGQDASDARVKTVQAHVWRLRKALGDRRGLIETTPAGYRLRVRPDELDVARFEQLVVEGRRALAMGQPEPAGTLLREALDLWRGPALADLAGESSVSAEIARLDEQRLTALEARIEADLAAGRDSELVGELRQLVSVHPARERLAGQLMLALYRCGRQAEALEAFQRARTYLSTQLGLEPGTKLRALQAEVLDQSSALELVADHAPRQASVSDRLLERDEQLARIAAALAEPGRVLVIEGEAGIGKTSLLHAAADLARDAGARVLTARGGELECGFGHGVARQLLEAPLRTASTAQRERWLASAAGLAAPALGLEPVGDADTVDDPAFAAQHGLYWLAANMTGDGPLVLVVDDLHWVDLASFRWLVYLARRLQGLDLVLLAGWRTGEPDTPQELCDALGGERLTLSTLSVAATAVIVTAGLERECDTSSAQACHRATHGNPLLLAQLAQMLDTDTELPLDTNRIASLGAPAVAPYVRARLGSLPPPAADVAAAAAVFDGQVGTRELAALTGLTLRDVGGACDALVRARLLVGRETLGFVHPLVRAAVYEALDPARRADAHRIAADVLDADGETDRAAVHLVAAERRGDATVVERLVAAAERAAMRGAVDEAVVLLTRALQEPPPQGSRFAILMSLSHAEWLARDEAGVEHARAALALAEEPEQYEAAAIRVARLLSPAGRQHDAIDVLASAADALRATAPERAVRLDVQRVSWSLMLPRSPRGTRETALSLVSQIEHKSLSGRILGGTIALGAAWAGALPASAAAELALDALADRQMLRDLCVAAPFHWPLTALGYCERLDDYAHWAELRRECAMRSGSRIEPPVLAAHRARIAWSRGDLATAIQEARESLADIETSGYAFHVPFAAAQLVAALVEQGDFGQARDVLTSHGIVTASRLRGACLYPHASRWRWPSAMSTVRSGSLPELRRKARRWRCDSGHLGYASPSPPARPMRHGGTPERCWITRNDSVLPQRSEWPDDSSAL
jgi:DNA-binding SARP family transcriptional activator